jgi:DNA-binding response OmpR family regulator
MTEKASIRVFIADDHAIVRAGLKQILAEERDISVVGEAETGLDAIKLFRKSRCNVLLLDISLPDRNGIEVLKQIKDDKPELAVLMLSMHREDQYAIRSLKAGASGYLTKQSAPRELVGAIRQVASRPALRERPAGPGAGGPDRRRPRQAGPRNPVRPRIPDPDDDRVGQDGQRDRQGTVAVGQDHQRIPLAPAGKNESENQRRADPLRHPQPINRLTCCGVNTVRITKRIYGAFSLDQNHGRALTWRT